MGRIAAAILGLLLAAWAPAADNDLYRALISRPSGGAVAQTCRDLATFGTRQAGSAGEQAAIRYGDRRLQALGFKTRFERFRVTVPDPLSTATLAQGSLTLNLKPFWPNLVRTSTCAVTGVLVDGGDGSLESLRGKTIQGSIVVLDFTSGSNWKNAAALGAKAIIFRDSRAPWRSEAEAKFLATPLDVPRFLIEKAAERLLRYGQSVSVRCTQNWEAESDCNLIADLPGSDAALSGQPIVLWAYADSMSVVPGVGPGAEQSGGLVALLELARLFSTGDHRRPLQIVISGAHCLRLQGAREFIEQRFSRSGITPLLVVTLDLSSGSKSLGVFGRGYAYNYRDELLDSVLPLCRALRRHAEQLTPLLGETLPRVVLTDAAGQSDNRTWKNDIDAQFAFDCEPFMSAGYHAITFATIDDSRPRVDTPDDSFDRVDNANLLRQIQVLTVMLHHILNDRIAQTGPDTLPLKPASPSRISLIGGFATASGYVAVYDPTKSLVPDVRVPGSLAVQLTNRKCMMGVRGDEVQAVSGKEGNYKFIGVAPLTDYATLFKPDTILAAYHVDPGTGAIDYGPDEGAFGSEAFPLEFGMTTSSRISPIVVFPCTATDLYGLVDPQDLTPFGTDTILDPVGGGPPRSFGMGRAVFDETSPNEADDTAVLLLPKGQRYQLLMGSQIGGDRLLLTGSTPANKAGVGYVAQGGSLGDVSDLVAGDISAINEARIREFTRYRILGPSVLHLQQEAESALSHSKGAAAVRDWPDAAREARAAWAYALRAHPILQGTASDVVDGVIFYSFLLIPFAFFFERLVFASRSLTQQVLVTAGVFIASFLCLRFVHPAFDLVANPAMIFVGFVMGALSLIVATFLLGKFETSLREVKQAASGIREVDVRRSNVAMAAFSLGISNLRRRRARTVLTTLTLAVMTFIVLSFTSIVPDLRLSQNPSPNAARYSGLLLRQPGLEPLRTNAYDALQNEFSGRANVVRRVYSFGADVMQGTSMSVQYGGLWADAAACEGFDPGESLVTRPQAALLPRGRWFEAGERNATILPAPMAAKLGASVGDTVRFMGMSLKVVGIFDPDKMKAIKDLDGESILPPDMTLSQRQQALSHSQAQAFRKFIRLDPSVCFFVPAETALALRGDIRSVAVSFADPSQTAPAMASLMPRLRLNLYAAVPSHGGLEVRQFSNLLGSKSTGFGLVVIQLIIASIFVLNTMIASVYERTKEISIFSAIGLAPNHIATLFFAESLVYGVLGVVFGYFAAEIVAKIIVATGAFPQLTLNFSSSSAILSALLVIGVVVGSTVYPARKAAKIAAPAMAEESLESEPEGDLWQLPLPFSVSSAEAAPLVAFLAEWLKAYEEYTIGSFVTNDTELSESRLRASATAWLAPYDLGVSQELLIEASPAPAEGTYELTLTVRRLSGEPRNWVTVNRRFLTSLRREFLTWRTLTDEERARFQEPSTLSSPA